MVLQFLDGADAGSAEECYDAQQFTAMTNEKARRDAYPSRQVPPWQLQSSFTNITGLHDDAISRVVLPAPPIGPSPLLELVIDNRPLKMASKKVTTAFSVRLNNSARICLCQHPPAAP